MPPSSSGNLDTGTGHRSTAYALRGALAALVAVGVLIAVAVITRTKVTAVSSIQLVN